MLFEKKIRLVFALLLSAILAFATVPLVYVKAEDQPVADGVYKVVSAINENYVWDISNGSGEDGANLQLWSDNGSNAQKFTFTYDGDGYYIITNINSGKVIDCANGSSEDGANVWQYSANDSDAQRWKLTRTENGYYILTCKCNGKAADVEAGTAENGTNIQMYGLNQSVAQEFRLAETKESSQNSDTKTEHSREFYYMTAFLILAAEIAVVIGAGRFFQHILKRIE